MSTKGKPAYTRTSNQSYPPIAAAQPSAVQSFSRTQRYPQQTVQSQTVQLGMQPLRMQYPTQHVNVLPPTIIQAPSSQNQVRAFIPAQSSQFVPNVHSSSFEPSHYPYVFNQGPAFYQPQAVAQPINYQTSGPQISQNVTGTQHMQMQTNQSTHLTSQPASVQPQLPTTWPDTKKAKVKIKITDPKQGGKDVTDEILKIKKENSAESSGSVVEDGEKIKAEFAAKVALAKDSRGSKEEERAIKEKESPKDCTEDISDLHGKNDVQSITTNEVKTEQAIDQSNEAEVVPSGQPAVPKSESSLNIEDKNINLNDQDISVTKAEEVLASENNHIDSEQNELEREYAPCKQDGGQSISPVDSTQASENDKEHNGIIASSEGDNSCSEPGLVNVADDSNKSDLICDKIELCDTAAASKTEEIIQTHVDEDSSAPQVSEPEVLKKDNASEIVNVPMNAAGEEKSDLEEAEGCESGLVKGSSSQASKKKKSKQRMKEISNKGTRDSDLMSAFTDRPEEEVEVVDDVKESEPEDLPPVEDTWEDKEIKIDSLEKSDKRIIYDRDFLLGFQFSKEKPKDLPDIVELVLPEAHPPTKPIDKSSRTQHSNHHDLMPQFMRQTSGNRQIGSGRGGKGSRTLPAKKIIPTSFETKVELKKAENAWVRPSEKVTEGQESPIEELYRKARGILNKLTPQNFPRLVEQMKNLDTNTAEKLRGVIDIIFEKALSEPGFSAAYAKLCDEISKQKIQLESGKGGHITFKRLLLNKCQAEFEKEKTDEQQLEKEQTKHFENAEEEKIWQEGLLVRKHQAKKRSLGNIRFIGELFKLKMLTEAIMHTCVVKLLRDGDEESLECLCQLLTTIGKDLDVEKAKQRTDQYFEQINKVIQQRKVCSRVIFMLQNIQELRATNWVSRRVADAPKTIAEIHKEAKQEEFDMQMAHQQAAQKRGLNKTGGRESPAMARSMQTTEEGWNHVPLSNKSNRPIQPVDPTKLKLTKRTDSDNISLGPGGRPGAWAQGASGGSSRFGGMQSNEDTRQGNRFQALSSGEIASRQDNKNRGSSRSNQQAGRPGRPSGPPSSGRRNQQQQHIEEKAAALENVRRMMGDQTKPNSHSNNAAKLLEEDKHGNTSSEDSTEIADNEQTSSVEPSVEPPVEPSVEPSADKIKKETKLTIEEFIVNHDLQEAENCIKELHSVTQNHLIISEALNIAVEKKHEELKAIGTLLDSFVRTKLISMLDFKTGLKEILEFADDISVDIPHIWTNLGVILAPLVVDNFLPLSELSTLIEPLILCNKAALLMAHILAAASEISEKAAVASIWHESGLNWRDLLNDENDAASFITKNGMEFTVLNEEGTMNNELLSLLKDSCTCDTAVEWIEKRPLQKSDSSFVSNLCTVVLNVGVQKDNSNIKFDCNAVKKYKALLVKYIGNDATKQLNALFAAQNLAGFLDHPQDFLKKVFEMLYDEDIINADSILKWEESEEQPQGKGVAIESVKELLEWLKTPDDNRNK